MSQELGRMERPSSEAFRGKRKLLLVPRVYPPPVDAAEGSAIVQRYWDQVDAQVASLESGLGPVRHVYHESITDGGDEALEQGGERRREVPRIHSSQVHGRRRLRSHRGPRRAGGDN